MIWNHLKVAWRTFKRHPIHTGVNVLGLGVAMASCLLVALYIQDELSYDSFHPDAGRIVVMATSGDGPFSGMSIGVPGALREVMAREIPGVREVTRTEHYSATVNHGGKNEAAAQGRHVLATDSSFFNVLSGFQVRGRFKSDPLDTPDEAVLTSSMAQDLFGQADPIGEAITVEIERPSRSEKSNTSRRYTVVGVVNTPSNSTLEFDLVVPEASMTIDDSRPWLNQTDRVYARIEDGVNSDSLGASVEAALPPLPSENLIRDVRAIPLPDLYLSEVYENPAGLGFKGELSYLYLFGGIALLILLIASSNYVNLMIAQAEQRSREVGVRKAIGARRGQITHQFLSESILLSLVALVLAIALVSVFLPAFNAVFRTDISLTVARYGWALIMGAGVVLAVSILASTYPALALSGRRATTILRGATRTTSGGGGWLRRGLIIAQFAVSAGLIFGTTTMYRQLDYLQSKDLGFDEDQVVTARVGDLSKTRRSELRQKIQSHSGVKGVSISNMVPGNLGRFRIDVEPETLSPEAKAEEGSKIRKVYIASVDTNYVETLGLDVIAGHNFSGTSAQRRRSGYVLNEAAVQALGWTPKTAIGRPFRYDREGKVIGVVEDFHVQSLRAPIQPVVLTLRGSAQPSGLPSEEVLVAQLVPGNIQAALAHIRQVVEEMSPEQAFSYTFLDERFDRMYQTSERLGRIFAGFGGLAIILACMGLFGLTAYATQRRTREIGIRKALGATTSRILALLSSEYVGLVIVALILGLPLAYMGVRRWLQGFAYQINTVGATLVMTTGIVLCVAVTSVSYNALRAAWTDPATAIRQE